MSFSWNSITCDESWYKTSRCMYDKHLPIDKSCINKLPAIINGVKFEFLMGRVKVSSMNNNLLVMGTCTEGFVSSSDECYNTRQGSNCMVKENQVMGYL